MGPVKGAPLISHPHPARGPRRGELIISRADRACAAAAEGVPPFPPLVQRVARLRRPSPSDSTRKGSLGAILQASLVPKFPALLIPRRNQQDGSNSARVMAPF